MAEQKQAQQPKPDAKVFTKINKGFHAPPKDKAILTAQFTKQGKILKSKRQFYMYDDSIYYYDDINDPNPKAYTKLDFELCFELIREKTDKKEQSPGSKKQKLGKIKGIKLDREGAICELFSTDDTMMIQWRNALRQKINQRGFHDLFKAQKKIGKGNFASVYLAERLEDDKLFAVKAFAKEAAYSQEKGKEALLTEIDLMRTLDSKYIMKLHEVFETDNSLYFILDLLEGGQLYDKIKAKYKFTIEEVRLIMYGLISGLAHMHSKKIMHRDLKPENILFRSTNSMECVIADLGLGTRADLKEYLFVRCGTPGYVAPEVVNIKDMNTTYDPVCDVFSLGLIFYTLLMGRPAFNGKTYNEVLAQNRAGIVKLDGPEFLRLSTDTYDLLKRMLQKDHKDRISSQQALEHNFFKVQIKDQVPRSMTEKKKEKPQKTDDFDDDAVTDDPKETLQQNMSKMTKDIQNLDIAKLKQQTLINSPAQSPQLLPRTLKQESIEADSCIAFKMARTPLLTGRVEDVEESSDNPHNLKTMGTPLLAPSKISTFGQSPLQKTALTGSPGTFKSQDNPQDKNTTLKNVLMKNQVRQTLLQEIDEKEEKKVEEPEKKENKPKNDAKAKDARNFLSKNI